MLALTKNDLCKLPERAFQDSQSLRDAIRTFFGVSVSDEVEIRILNDFKTGVLKLKQASNL